VSGDEPVVECSTVDLERLRTAVQVITGGRLGESVGNSVYISHLADTLAYNVEACVLAERLPPKRVADVKRVEVRYPDGWWETLRHTYRQRWWMRWWVARRPVRWHVETRTAYLVVELDRFWTYPRASIALPELGEPVRVAQWHRSVEVR
jgi:hypothetical protein